MGNSQSEIPAGANSTRPMPTAESVQPKNEATAEIHHPKQTIRYEYEAILKEADLFVANDDDLLDHLHAGIFLNQMKEKFWVEKRSGKNSFMLLARGLSITWDDTPSYWQWKNVKEAPARDEQIEVVELMNVCWLEIHGKYEISRLSPETAYEVVFVIMLKDPAYGWEVPVNLRLVLPDGARQESRQSLMEKPRGRWIEIPAGEFRTTSRLPAGRSGTVEFSMYEYEGGKWKRGMVLKGVLIRPKMS